MRPGIRGGKDTVPLQSNIAQFLQLRDEHTKARHIHDNHHNMDVDLKKMVLEAVNLTYMFLIHNVFTGYMGSFMMDIIIHMEARYRFITATDIKMRKKSLQ